MFHVKYCFFFFLFPSLQDPVVCLIIPKYTVNAVQSYMIEHVIGPKEDAI